MGTDNDGVAALQGAHGVMHGVDDRVGGGGNAAHHANGLGHLDNTVDLVPLDDAPALLILHPPPGALGFVLTLGFLAVVPAHAGLVHRHMGQLFRVVVNRLADGPDRLVHVLLRQLCKGLLGRPGLRYQLIQIFLDIHIHNKKLLSINSSDHLTFLPGKNSHAPQTARFYTWTWSGYSVFR